MLGNCWSVVSGKELRNSSKLRVYRNVVNQGVPDSVDPFPLVEWVPEILAIAKKEAGARYRYFNLLFHCT
ncbi:MAG: hypothetical protein ACLQVJ_04160 [Syntrophobacteraceae bacterium]